jgi:DNA-binding MarR family transcriptional regulator
MSDFMKYRMAGALDVPPSAKLLYLVLAETIGGKGKAVIAHKRISETLGMNRKTVSRNLRRLEQSGHIAIEPTYNECGGRMPNRYSVL